MSKPIETVYAAFGMRIRVIRESLGLTQQEVAKRVGMTRTCWVNIECGRQRVSLHIAEQMANALGTSCKHLLRGMWW